jgi:PAS domain S-box-containing protein
VSSEWDIQFGQWLESMPDAMLVAGPFGSVAFANAAAERLFGYGPRELLEQPLTGLLGDDPAQPSSDVTAPHAGHCIQDLRMKGRRRDGSAFPVQVSRGTLPSASGLLLVSAVRAAPASRPDTALAPGLSHELRTPLNAIIGFSDLLCRGKVGAISAKQQEFLRDILSSGRRLLELVDDMSEQSE